MSEARPWLGGRAIGEIAVALVMIGLAFAAIASSDMTATGTQRYWAVLVVVFAAICLAADRVYTGHNLTDWRSAVAILLHWTGVFLAVYCLDFFVASGRMANADAGLTGGLILALGTFIAGAHSNWRLLIVGAALGGATLVVAAIEEYMWILFGIAVAALIILVLGSRFMPHRSRHAASV